MPSKAFEATLTTPNPVSDILKFANLAQQQENHRPNPFINQAAPAAHSGHHELGGRITTRYASVEATQVPACCPREPRTLQVRTGPNEHYVSAPVRCRNIGDATYCTPPRKEYREGVAV